MTKQHLLFFFLFWTVIISAQDGFHFETEKKKVSIPFKLINNLVFIPINVNGVELTFLLDSGVQETILFSVEEKGELNFKNIEKTTLRGLGSEEAIDALKSVGNTLEVKGIKSRNHLLYIIVDPYFNLSSHIGIPVHGIMGYPFFKNNLIEINYEKKKVIFYKDNQRNRKRMERNYKKLPVTIERSKPYVNANVIIDSSKVSAKLLIDVGNSDAVWLFQNSLDKIKVPANNFDDFLGRGFSGDVEGKRARITSFLIADFEFSKPIIAFPDSTSIKHVTMVEGRVGSVGGEILKRFSIVFDYKNGFLYLKKNRHYSDPFVYNKSGIEIVHSGLQWIQERILIHSLPVKMSQGDANKENITSNYNYKFQLLAVFEIANIRKNSLAARSGLQVGDEIISINRNQAYKYSLEEINSFLRTENDKWITLEVQRRGKLLKFRFQLIDVL